MFIRYFVLICMLLLMISCSIIQPNEGGTDSGESSANIQGLPANLQGLFLQAQQDMQAGRYENAIELFTQISESESELAMPHINMAISYYELKQFDKALSAIEQALGKSKSSYEAFNVHGLLMRQKGDFTNAKKSYESALSIKNDYTPALQNLGILCDVYLQDYACAKKTYEVLVELMPENKQFKGWLSDVERR